MALSVKNPGDPDSTLCGEDPLEKEMVTHGYIIAWETPWTEEPGELQPIGSQELNMT